MNGKIRFYCGVAALFFALNPAARAVGTDDFVALTFNDGQGHTLPYRLFAPKNDDQKKKYPLVLYFHGAGGRGNDNLKQMTDVPRFLALAEPAVQERWPCFILAPQCPENMQWVNMPWNEQAGAGKFCPATWPMEASIALLDSIAKQYREIDTNRLYVTGISMGGYGTWDAICRYPTKFRAAVPVCGGGDPLEVAKVTELKNVAVRAYHCADDGAVPVGRTREMIDAMKALNGIQPRYIEFPDGGHDAYTRAYMDPALPQWMFSFKGTGRDDKTTATGRQWDVLDPPKCCGAAPSNPQTTVPFVTD